MVTHGYCVLKDVFKSTKRGWLVISSKLTRLGFLAVVKGEALVWVVVLLRRQVSARLTRRLRGGGATQTGWSVNHFNCSSK